MKSNLKNLLGSILLLGLIVPITKAQQPPADPATNSTTAPAPGATLTQAQLNDTLTKLGAVVTTTPDGAITSIIFKYTHNTRMSPGGAMVPPYLVTDDLVHQISKLPTVTAIECVMSHQLTEAAVKDIGGMQQLEHLALGTGHINDTSMADLAGLTNLTYLRLSDATAVTDAGWATLVNFKKLQSLSVDETRFGNSAAPLLAQLTQLKELTFYGTLLTDSGADVLLGLPNLTSVRLGGRVSKAEMAKLKAALPNCRFYK